MPRSSMVRCGRLTVMLTGLPDEYFSASTTDESRTVCIFSLSIYPSRAWASCNSSPIMFIVGLLGYALQHIAVGFGLLVYHQCHLALALYGGERIVYLVRRIVDEHLLCLIILVDAVEYAQGVEVADYIKHACREHHQQEHTPEQHAVDVLDKWVATEYHDGECARVVIVDKGGVHLPVFFEVHWFVVEQASYLVLVKIAHQLTAVFYYSSWHAVVLHHIYSQSVPTSMSWHGARMGGVEAS